MKWSFSWSRCPSQGEAHIFVRRVLVSPQIPGGPCQPRSDPLALNLLSEVLFICKSRPHLGPP